MIDKNLFISLCEKYDVKFSDKNKEIIVRKENENMEILQVQKINLKKLSPDAVIPTYGSEYAAGADLYACINEPITIEPNKTVIIKTGIAMEIPVGYAGLIYARSGLASKKGLAPANKVGVIDTDYRGEIMVALHNHSELSATIEPKERIAQLVITPYIIADFDEVENLNETERGESGFGSTGDK